MSRLQAGKAWSDQQRRDRERLKRRQAGLGGGGQAAVIGAPTVERGFFACALGVIGFVFRALLSLVVVGLACTIALGTLAMLGQSGLTTIF